MKKHTAVAVLAVFVFLALASSIAGAAEQAAPATPAVQAPLRSGTILTKFDAGALTYFMAVDAAGKEFWVITSICTIGDKGPIEVVDGAHYDKIKSVHREAVLEDVYTAKLLKIGDVEVKGFGAHGLPDGCLVTE